MTEPGPEVPAPPQADDEARARWLRRAWIAVAVGWLAVIFVGSVLFFYIRGLEQAARESAATVAERPRVKPAERPEPLDEAPPDLPPEPPAERPPEPATPPVVSTQPEIQSDDDIRQHISLTMTRKVRDLQACYAEELRSAPDFGGTFTLDFSIQRDGTPHQVQVTGDDLPESLALCLTETVMGFRFSPIAKEAPVRYPLVFRPGT